MPRSATEIESEMTRLREGGMHPATKEMRALRAELASVQEPAATVEAPETTTAPSLPPDEAPTVTVPGGAVLPGLRAVLETASPLDSDEWRFIQDCISRMEIEFGGGSTTGAVKRLYNEIDARRKVWLLVRDIVKQVGLGGEWPQFSALGRDGATGRKLDAPPPPAPKPPPQVVIPPTHTAPAPSVTEGGMPIGPASPAAALASMREQIRAQMNAGMQGSSAPPSRIATPAYAP